MLSASAIISRKQGGGVLSLTWLIERQLLMQIGSQNNCQHYMPSKLLWSKLLVFITKICIAIVAWQMQNILSLSL